MSLKRGIWKASVRSQRLVIEAGWSKFVGRVGWTVVWVLVVILRIDLCIRAFSGGP